jgi:uncharacterized protein (TIGR00661 family)
MKRIVYGVAGEGLGHTIRALSIGRVLLSNDCEVIFLVNETCEKYLSNALKGFDNVYFVRVNSPCFFYDSNNNISVLKTIFYFFKDWFKRRSDCLFLERCFGDVDLFISDYDPISSWTAKRLKKRLITISSQNFYNYVSPFSILPINLWIYFFFIKLSVLYFGVCRSFSIICHFNDMGQSGDDYMSVGPIIRDEIDINKRKSCDFTLVYINNAVEEIFFNNLGDYAGNLVVYGLGKRDCVGNIVFKDIDFSDFVLDLHGCSRVICTAGTTLISECLYLKIPFLLTPIPNQKEQLINSYLLDVFGVDSVRVVSDYFKIRRFLDKECDINYPNVVSGTEDAASFIINF